MSGDNDIYFNNEACYKRLPVLLAPFNSSYDFEFRDDKIIFPCEYKANIIIYFVIIALISPLILLIILDYTQKFGSFILEVLVFIFTLFVFILRKVFIKPYRVIYYKDKYIATDIFIFGIRCAQINKINFNSINKVANDISWTGYIKDPDKDDDRGDLIYKVSLLLNDGKIFNLYSLGIRKKDYQESINIAKAVSNGLAVPLIICQDGYRLKSVLTYSGYTFSLKKIIKKEKSSIFKLFMLFLAFLFLILNFFGSIYFYSMAKSKTGIELWKIKRDIKTIFKIK